MIELPIPDKRYKVGNIAKDKHGNYRGHPITVIPKRMEILTNHSYESIRLSLNPPIVISEEMAQHIKATHKN